MKQFLKGNVRLPILRDALWKNRNFLVIFTLTLFLCFPVPLLLDIYYDGIQSMGTFSSTEMVVMYFATIVMLLVIPFFFFNYLTKKRSVDFIHSLPISRSDLFVTYSLASFLMVLIPFTLTYWTGMIITYFTHTNGFQFLDIITYIRAILVFAAIQIPTIFVIMNTGTLSDSVIFSFILYIAPFVAYFAISNFASSYLLGFTNLSSTNILMYISPSAFLISTLIPGLTAIDVNVLNLYWFVFALAGYIVSCAMYRHWKSEFSERPFNNDYFYPFVTSLFTAFLFIFMMALFSIDTKAPLKFLSLYNLIIPLLFTYVFYVILDFIKHRSTKFFFRATKHYAYIIIFALSLSTIIFTTQGFGYAWNVPDAKTTESVTVELNTYFNKNSNKKVVIEDPETIATIITIHQDMVDQFKEANQFFAKQTIGQEGNIGEVTFDYRTEDNSKLKRTFVIPSELFEELFALEQIPDIAINRSALLLGGEVFNPSLFSTLGEREYQPSTDDMTALKEAFIQDLHAFQSKDFSSEDFLLQYQLTYEAVETDFDSNYRYEDTILIDNRFTNTLKVIEGFEMKTVEYDYYFPSNFYTDRNEHIMVPLSTTWDISDTEVPTSFEEVKGYSNSIFTFNPDKSIQSAIIIVNKGQTPDNFIYNVPVFK